MTYYVDLKTKSIDNAPRENFVEFYGDINGLIEHECEEYTLEILDLYRQEKPPVQVYNPVTESTIQVPTESELKARELLGEKQSIMGWFTTTDYIVNKVFLEEWSKDDPRYLAYLEQRKLYRERLNEIDKELSKIVIEEVQLNGN